MSRKRRNTSSPEFDEAPSPNCRSHEQDDDSEEEESNEAPYFDEYSGQTGAFPGLGSDRDALFYGPALDGLDYLRMVRSEAKSVPYILTAAPSSRPNIAGQEEMEMEEGGYYYDGAYTAVTKASTTGAYSIPPAQQHYYDSLLAQFRLVRATLRCTPPLSDIEKLRPEQLISFPQGSRKARSQWEAHIISASPHPVQVACMDSETVLQLVMLLRKELNVMILHKDPAVISRVGTWAWAILGRSRDRGELGSEEVGELRELAQRAIHLQRRRQLGSQTELWSEDGLSDDYLMEDAIERKDVGDHSAAVAAANNSKGDSTQADEGVALEEAAGEDPERRDMVNMILDTIITIVGEIYGQRDLLELRIKWTNGQT